MTKIEYLGSREMCLVCFKPPEIEKTWIGEQPIALVKHHLSYFPEKIAFVHYQCHKKIHDTPLNAFIQYSEGDARKFYDQKKFQIHEDYNIDK